MTDFINSLELDDLVPMSGDMSPRRYARGVKGGVSSIIMRYPDANDEARQEMGAFLKITDLLAAHGVKVPELLAFDEESLAAQFEDLGAQSFGDLRRFGLDMAPYYRLATDVLKHLATLTCPHDFTHYHEGHIHHKRRQFVEYYLPIATGTAYRPAQMDGYLAAWDQVQRDLPPCPEGFLHVDYHLENLMWCEGEQGMKRCGLIDYQDAVIGPLPYDLVNLLEDARVDVDPALKRDLIEHYCTEMNVGDKEAFIGWYDLLAAQFHCRVIGLFIMQAVENKRDDYLSHITRLENYLRAALDKPVLAPFKAWCVQEGVDFAPQKDLSGDHIRNRFQNLK